MSKLWMTIEQEDGQLVIKGPDGRVVTTMQRTKPSYVEHAASRWADDLVSDVQRVARHAMRLIVTKDPESTKF